jgi:signal transduction histidine kinase
VRELRNVLERAALLADGALKLVGNLPGSRVACDAWIGLAWAYAQVGEFSRALRYSLQGLKTARRQAEPEHEAHALDVLGCVYAIFGDPVEALRHLEQAAQIARETGNRRRLCSVLNNLAMTLLGQGELEAALAAGQESLQIAQADALAMIELNVTDTVASVLTALGRLPEAESCLAPAVTQARKRRPSKLQANLLGSLGAVRAASGDAVQAEALYAQALAIATDIGDPVLMRQGHRRLADLLAGLGRWQEAYGHFQRYHGLNEALAGAKAAKRLTVVRIADEVDALHDALDPDGPRVQDSTALDALEALTARLRARNRELAEAQQAAEVAHRTRSRFLANMSHELRTPLNGLLGMAQLLMRTPLDAQQARWCQALLDSGRALGDQISNILEYTRIEAGQLALDTIAFEPLRVVEQALAQVRPKAAAKGLGLVSGCDPGVPRVLLGDATRIEQVLQQLLGNALKFTPKGEVQLRVTRLPRRGDDARVWLRWAVQDTGIGLSVEHASAVFQPFVQADDASTRAVGGSGLGLAISRQLVQLMGGSLELRSEPGQGTTVWFDVPFRPTEDA